MHSAGHQRTKSLWLCCLTSWSGLGSSDGVALSPSQLPRISHSSWRLNESAPLGSVQASVSDVCQQAPGQGGRAAFSPWEGVRVSKSESYLHFLSAMRYLGQDITCSSTSALSSTKRGQQKLLRKLKLILHLRKKS